MKKAALHNLGCKVNAYETEAMQEMLEKAGYEIVPFKEGADLYVINTKDGKDKIEPTFVGEKVRVIMADDGAILISKTKKDLVTKVDKKGKIVWSIDAKYSILNNSDDAYYDSANNNINGLQVINGNYVLSYNGDDGSQKDENEYNFGVGTCYLVFDKDGNIILEELEEKKTDNGNDEKAYTENYDDYDEENY